jgi:hypothetical protein
MKKPIPIKRSHTLMNIAGNLTLNATKIWLLGLSTIKWMDDNNIEINNKGQVITTLNKKFLEDNLPQVMRQKNYIRQLQTYCKELSSKAVGTVQENENSWVELGSYATKASYQNDELKIFHNIDIIDLVDTKNKFCEYFYEKIANLSSKNHIKTYDLCISQIKLKKRTESIEFLRGFYNLKPNQFKQNSDFIKHTIKTSIECLGKDKNIDIDIDFKPIKTGRKITHVEFSMKYKDDFYALKLKSNNLRANLISFGISPNKVKSFVKYNPGELLEAYKSTDKARIKAKSINQKFSVEGYFVKTVANIHSQSRTEEKGRSVAEFLDTLSIENKNLLLTEFENSLSAETKNNIEKQRNSDDESVRENAREVFNSNYYKWIYYNKMVIK